MKSRLLNSATGLAIGICAAYVAAAASWIVISDWLLSRASQDALLFPLLQAFKGLLFVAVSAAVLFVVLKAILQRRLQADEARRVAESGAELALSGGDSALWEFRWKPGAVLLAEIEFKVHPQIRALLGVAPEAMTTAAAWARLVHPSDRGLLIRQARDCFAGRSSTFESRFRAQHASGEWRWLRCRGRAITDGSDGFRRCAGIFWDVSAEQHSHLRIDRLARALDCSDEGILIADADRRVVMHNRSLGELIGRDAGTLENRTIDELLFDSSPEQARTIWAAVEEAGAWSGPHSFTARDGRDIRCEIRISRQLDAADGSAHYTGLLFDVTELEMSREQLEFLRHYDALTQLPNAKLLHQRLAEAVRDADRSGGGLAVFAIDLSNFQRANESLGRSAGDQLLRLVGQRLARLAGGVRCAARFDGDRFALVVESVRDAQEALLIIRRIDTALAEGFLARGRTVHLTACVGGALYPQHGTSADALMQSAECALRNARLSGAGEHRLYQAEMSDAATEGLRLESALRDALRRGALDCQFQPKVDLKSGRCIGAEALLRWRHEGQWISPSRFVPIAEECGLIGELGYWVLKEAIGRAARWHQRGVARPGFRVAVNLAGPQLKDQLVADVETLLRNAKLPASMLTLELTETVVMSNPTTILGVLERLRGMGVVISIDDFGTGYSSLSHLQRLPVDELKVDRSFVSGLPEDGASMEITRSIIALAQVMGLTVVAEGVERPEQRLALIELGCTQAQGFLWGAAVTAGVFEQQLAPASGSSLSKAV